MPRFVIDLGDIEMSKADQMKLNGDLQRVALGHLSGIKFSDPFVVRFPWEWLGIILRRDFEGLQIGEKEIAKGLGQLQR